MALPRTTASIHSETVAIARAAEFALEQGRDSDEPLLHILRTRLQRERDAGMRLRLARAYLRLLRASALPLATTWIRGTDPWLRQAAYDVLRELREDSLPALLDLVDDRDPEARWYAIEVAAHIHRPSTLPVLIRGLQDDDQGNRWAAGNGLIALGDRALIPTLTALVTAPATVSFHAAARRVLSRLEIIEHEDVARRLLESLGRSTTTVLSGPIASEWLAALRRGAALRQRVVRPLAPRHAQRRLSTTIRVAGDGDAREVQALWDACGLAVAGESEWNALTGQPTSTILVAEYAGHVVGCAVTTFDGWRAYVYHVAVAEPVRGQGVGHDLLTAAEERLLAAGARHVHAAVHEDNTGGLALAVAKGYLPEGERVLVKSLETA